MLGVGMLYICFFSSYFEFSGYGRYILYSSGGNETANPEWKNPL